MKRFAAAAFFFLLNSAMAIAMSASQIPSKFPIPWANNAGSAYIRSIPQNSQIGIQNCAASLTDGFPPLTFVPSSAGGCPPFGQDFNGILNQISLWSQWQSAGGPIFYDSGFASSIGGYPKGATVASSVTFGLLWTSTVDNNTTNPDTGGAGWVQSPGQIPIGTPVPFLGTTAPTGYVIANGTTIGSASSGAAQRANADTQFLYSFLWSNCATCTVSGGKGATAAADFAANKTITTPAMQGLSVMGVDTMGGGATTFLAGVPSTSGSSTVPGSVFGENLHTLTASQLPTITPTFAGTTQTWSTNQANIQVGGSLVGGIPENCGSNCALAYSSGPTPQRVDTPVTPAGTISSFGSNGSHNTVERSMLVYWLLKL